MAMTVANMVTDIARYRGMQHSIGKTCRRFRHRHLPQGRHDGSLGRKMARIRGPAGFTRCPMGIKLRLQLGGKSVQGIFDRVSKFSTIHDVHLLDLIHAL